MSKQNDPGGDFENLGHVIEQEVNKTIESLSGTVQDVVHAVSETVRQNTAEGMQRFSDTLRGSFSASYGAKQGRQNAAQTEKTPFSQQPFRQHTREGYGYNYNSYASRKQAESRYGKNGWLRTISGMAVSVKHVMLDFACGFIGLLAVCCAVGVTAVLLGLGTEPAGMESLGVLLPVLGITLCAECACLVAARRMRRFQQYLCVLEGKAFCKVEDLAADTGLRPGVVRGDLRRILKKGWLRAARLSSNETMLFIDSETYRMYQSEHPQSETEPKNGTCAAQQEAQEGAPLESEGKQFLRALRGQKELLNDAAVLEQVEHIEQHTQNIFEWVQAHPSSTAAVRRFTSYYLPTVLKLLKTYNEVNKQADDSAVASQIQSDIVGILYTVNTAFASLQDDLLQDTAMDISAEISALETVLAQEGLTDSAIHTGQ